MRWAALGIAVFSLVCTAVSAECIDEKCLEIQLETLMGSVNEKKAIYCEGTNIQPMDMEWYSPEDKLVLKRTSNNRVYVEGRKEKTLNKGLLVLIITNLSKEDHGNWTCKGKTLELSDSIEVTVGVKASVDRTKETKVEQAGTNVKMNCTAKGDPTPTVQWYRERDLIENGVDPRLVISQNKNTHFLLIKNVDYADSGTYVCKATQKRLTHYAHKDITLEVLHRPIIFDPDTQRPVESPPSKNKGETFALKEIFVVANEPKVITCNAIANPLPEFKWSEITGNFGTRIKNDEKIKNDTFSSNLTVTLKDKNDVNKYKCEASNDLGKAILEYHITLGEPPIPPDDIKFVSANHTYINFDVTCTNCTLFDKETEGVTSPDPHYLPIKGYVFQLAAYQEKFPANWEDENNEEIQVEIEKPNITIFSVGPLPNSTTFHVRVRSYNDAGFSTWLEMDNSWLELTKTDSATDLVATVLLLLATVLLVTMCR